MGGGLGGCLVGTDDEWGGRLGVEVNGILFFEILRKIHLNRWLSPIKLPLNYIIRASPLL